MFKTNGDVETNGNVKQKINVVRHKGVCGKCFIKRKSWICIRITEGKMDNITEYF